MRKNEPLLGIKGQFDAFVGSLRRSEGAQRKKTPILAVDPEMNCLRVNPLANFSDKQLDDYVQEHQVIVNPLHSQGYTTIGCNRCTTPVPRGPLAAPRPLVGVLRHQSNRLRARRECLDRPVARSRRPHSRPSDRLRDLNEGLRDQSSVTN
jgi:3'-phosphoadenosine 5'-phosphosulfate sulfotransferase (PAPS reductase)/FAD synthetase